MKKTYLFSPQNKRWNTLVRKFRNLYKRIKKGNSSEKQMLRMTYKLKNIYKKLEKLQYRAGIKLAGTSLAFLLISALCFSQENKTKELNIFTYDGNLKANGFYLDVGSWSAPVFADLNNDGIQNLYVGNSGGYIEIFEYDEGETFIPHGNLTAGGSDINVGSRATPVFADIDLDGDLDLYVGNSDGTIHVFINDDTGNLSFGGYLQASGTAIDVGDESAPTFADIDDDGDLDLYVGWYYGIEVFLNEGSGIFTNTGTLINLHGGPFFPGPNPTFADLDDDGDLDLYIGGRFGNVLIYLNDGFGNFAYSGYLQADGTPIIYYYDTTPCFEDYDNDGDLDLYLGFSEGIINYFSNDGFGNFTYEGFLHADNMLIDVGSNSSPVFADIDGDNDQDLYIGESGGSVQVFINDNTGVFCFEGNLQALGVDINVGGNSAPVFADIDEDGDKDLYAGCSEGIIKVFTNDGTGKFEENGNLQADGIDIDVNSNSKPAFADIDNDGDFDLYVGEDIYNYYSTDNGYINLFINNGSGIFSSAGHLQADGTDIDVGGNSSPAFADIDNDGDLDLIVGSHYSNYFGWSIGLLYVYLNDGIGNFSYWDLLQADGSTIDEGGMSSPIFADLDSDNDLDLYVGNKYGYISVYKNLYSECLNDTTAPVPNVDPLSDIIWECNEITITDIPTATDNCAGLIYATTSDPLTYTEPGTYTITWTYDDGNGNISVQTQNLCLSNDISAPVPDMPVLPDIIDECSVIVTNIPAATDNCAGTINGTTSDPLEYNEVGTYVITWTYDDGHGNTETQTQNVNLTEDISAPVPDNPALGIIWGECSVKITDFPTATDQCVGLIIGTTTDPLSYNDQGLFTVTWTYDDGNGFITTQEQFVIVDDTTHPYILCRGNQVVTADISGTYTISGTEFDPWAAFDNCESVCLQNDLNNDSTLNGAVLPIGTTTITWTATDIGGNESSCSFDVLVTEYIGTEKIQTEQITIYPNPASGMLIIETNDKYTLSIIDQYGRKVKEISVSEKEIIDVGDLLSGVYILNFKTDNENITKKIILQ